MNEEKMINTLVKKWLDAAAGFEWLERKDQVDQYRELIKGLFESHFPKGVVRFFEMQNRLPEPPIGTPLKFFYD
jgi:hypothetical protein